MSKVMTLSDYAANRGKVLLFWASVGTRMGEHAPLNHPDLDFAARNDLLDLSGTVEQDQWCWDGKGNPTDDQRNTIFMLTAFVNEAEWDRIVNEYEHEYGAF